MSANTQIEWTDHTWNFIAAYAGNKRGWFCTKRTKACAHCYAEAINLRLGNGLEYLPKNLDKVEFRVMPDMLEEPLRWRTGRKVFVNSMTDFFHPSIPDWMRRIGFAVMMCRPKCWFQILTKQPEQMEKFFQENSPGDCFTEAQHRADDYPLLSGMASTIRPATDWPLYNVALIVSVGEQKDADDFIPYLLRSPAAFRGLSLEPLLGPVDLPALRIKNSGIGLPGLDWLIIGGESGKKARPCDLEWLRSLVGQGKAAGVPVFVKQLGANVQRTLFGPKIAPIPLKDFKHSKGGDWSEWPEDLRVRQFPTSVPQ